MYTEECMSTYEIAKELNTYPNKIRRYLKKNGIELKNKSSAQKNALHKGISKIPTKGKRRSKEERLKISKSMQKKWKSMSEKDYEKRVAQAKKRWYDMTEEQKQQMSKLATTAIQKAGKEGSKLEKYIYRELTERGYAVETHKKNIIVNENLEIDMYIPKLKAIIEIDGPSHFLPIWGEEKLKKQIKADQNKTGLILSKGFVIIRVKCLTDNPCLSDKHNLSNILAEELESIGNKMPSKSKRYIEIEI